MAFDPNKPFEVVGNEPSGFDPNKPFEPVAEQARPTFETPTAMSGRNFMVSGFQAAPEAQAQGVIGMTRYAAPVAAGLATGGLGLVPAMVASGAATAGSEALAQGLEGEAGMRGEIDYRRIAGSGIAGSVVPIPLRAAAQSAVSTGQAVVNFLQNAGAMTAANEAASFVEKGQFQAPQGASEFLVRFGAPVALAGVGTKASLALARQEARVAKSTALADERFGGTVMLGEVEPSLSEFEARRFRNNNTVARKAAYSMDQNLGNVIKRDIIDGSPNPDQIAAQFVPYLQDTAALKQQYDSALVRQKALEDRATIALTQDVQTAVDLEKQAQEAAVEAVKLRALSNEGTRAMLGSLDMDVSQVARSTRLEYLSQLADASTKAVKRGLTELYGRSGINMGAPVARVSEVRKNIAQMVDDPVKAGEMIEMFDSAIKRPGMLTNGGDLTLAGYRNVRDLISDGLVSTGSDRTAATRKAGQAYNAAKAASESYIESVYPKDMADAFKAANKAAAGVFQAGPGSQNAIRYVMDGEIDKLVALIEKEGYGPTARELESYAAALSNVGDKASRAAGKQFMSGVGVAIRDHLIDTSIKAGQGVDEAARVLDVGKLVQRVDSLRQKGVSPQYLGFPQDDVVKALARVSNQQPGAITQSDLQRFMDDTVRIGVPAAEARMAYENGYKQYLTSSDSKVRRLKAEQLERLRKEAKFEVGEAEAAYQRAINDPLVRLFNQPGISVSPTAGANPEYVNRLLSAGRNSVQALTRALQEPVLGNPELTLRRLNNLAALKKSAIADVFGETFRRAISPGDQRVELERITDFFYGPTQATEREAFKSLIGAEAFTNLQDRFVAPVQKILKQREVLKQPLTDITPELIVGTGFLGQLQGKTTGGVVLGNFYRRGLGTISDRAYNVFYGLYVDPVISRDFLRLNGDINAFVNSSPRNAMLYQMMLREDEANNPQQSPAR
jgi:hypothetical protein